MPVAILDVWSDRDTERSCHVLVHDDGYELQVRGAGPSSVTLECGSLEAALQQAEQWRPPYLESRSTAA
jgi:hypothetical protein